VEDKAVLAATEGPRYETPAEIRMLQKLGSDIVGMTGSPEVFLARELEICYSAVCFISNMAAGMQERLSALDVVTVGQKIMPALVKIIRQTVEKIPVNKTCSCSKAIQDAQV
jgi:5'-methylthioadenosine phosphorylase